MRIRTNCMALLVGGLLGASAAGVPTEASWPALGALVPRRLPLIPQQSPSAAPRTTPASTPAATLQEGHWGAESSELRALRRAEEQLFADDTLGPPASMPQPPTTEACEAPPADEWRASSALGAGPSPRWPNGIRMPSLPVRQNPRVAKYIRYFSNSPEGRKLFTTWLRRSGRYRSVITRALEQRDLPRDLLSIVFVESGFWPTAVSSAGAVGLWQFMPQTAKAYGLSVARDYDERQSIFQATNAAADHLSDLFARFQSWDLALAAYNLGYGSLSDRLQQYGVDDFWSLAQIPDALPKETELYVPKVLAVAVLMNNLEYFGFGDVELARPIDAAELEVPSGIRLSMVARAAGTSARALRELNPQIRSDILPDRGEPLTLFVPGNGLAAEECRAWSARIRSVIAAKSNDRSGKPWAMTATAVRATHAVCVTRTSASERAMPAMAATTPAGVWTTRAVRCRSGCSARGSASVTMNPMPPMRLRSARAQMTLRIPGASAVRIQFRHLHQQRSPVPHSRVTPKRFAAHSGSTSAKHRPSASSPIVSSAVTT